MVEVVHDGKRYVLEGHRGEGSFRDLLKWQMEGKRARWPWRVKNRSFPPPPERVEGDALKATWIGHSTVLLQTRGLNILTDPFLSSRASPVPFAGPRRVRPAALTAKTLPPIDLILLSHNHYDHMDLSTLQRLNERFNPLMIVSTGNKALIESIGCHRVEEMDWWEEIRVNEETWITFAPTQHFSGRGLWDRFASLWGSFMIHTRDKRIYFGADAGYSNHFRDIRQRLGEVDLAFLPIGAYEPRWFMKSMHVNPEEAVLAHQELSAKLSIAIHFGTFQLAAEAIDQPISDLKKALAQAGVDEKHFIVPGEGQTLILSL